MSAVLSDETFPHRVGKLIGLNLSAETDMFKVVLKGLPTSAYKALGRHVALEPTLIASESTMRRRLEKGGRFTLEESERLMRMARVFALAVEVFGDEARAKRWFGHASNYLPGESLSPLQMCETEAGGRIAEEHLRRAQYGFTA